MGKWKRMETKKMNKLSIIGLGFGIIVVCLILSSLHFGDTVIGTHQQCSTCYQQPLFSNIQSNTPYPCDCETIIDYEETTASKTFLYVALGLGLFLIVVGNVVND